MPIYDNDGTTSREIAKVWDYNGTTAAAIDKIYDHNGQSAQLIFTDTTPIFEKGIVNTQLVGALDLTAMGGASGSFSGQVIAGSCHNDPLLNVWSNVVCWSRQQVNLSGYSSLKISATAFSGDAQVYLLVASTRNYSDNAHLFATAQTSLEQSGEQTLALSSLQASYYVGFDIRLSQGWYHSGSVQVTGMWLE